AEQRASADHHRSRHAWPEWRRVRTRTPPLQPGSGYCCERHGGSRGGVRRIGCPFPGEALPSGGVNPASSECVSVARCTTKNWQLKTGDWFCPKNQFLVDSSEFSGL